MSMVRYSYLVDSIALMRDAEESYSYEICCKGLTYSILTTDASYEYNGGIQQDQSDKGDGSRQARTLQSLQSLFTGSVSQHNSGGLGLPL